ncbi:MAG: hypothetical protein K1X28_04250 [Parachlamydiales bacterium]|nr:hypothetical protein [Parachlamydiales bacterium]
MKRKVWFFLLLSFFAYAHDVSMHECCEEVHSFRPFLEVKGGYFIFANEKMRDVYKKGGLDIQISARYPAYKWIQVYGSVEYAQRHGRSLNGNEYTRIYLLPVSLGAQAAVYLGKPVEWYFTIGPRYFFLQAHNDSSSVDRNINKNGIGGFANTGFLFVPADHLLIDLCAEYSYLKANIHSHKRNVFGRDIQVGGFAFSVGVGYVF